MIDIFLKIIDRLIQLTELRDKRLRRMFDEIFTPIFSELELVHNDYDAIFKSTQALLINREQAPEHMYNYEYKDPYFKILPSSKELSNIIDVDQYRNAMQFLRKNRQEFEPLRIKLRASLPALTQIKICKEADDFIKSVINYFPNGFIENDYLYSNQSISCWIVRQMENRLIEYLDQRDQSTDTYLKANLIRADFSDFLDGVLCFYRNNWEDVVREYMTLKIKAVSTA